MGAVTGALKRWWRPSLTGRVVKALLLAFLLVAVVLVLVDYAEYRRGLVRMEPLRDAVRALALALPADEAGALQVVRASEQQYNYLRRRVLAEHSPPLGDLLFELSHAGGQRVVYASPGLAGLKGQALPAQSAPVLMLELSARRYSAVQAYEGPWRVRLLQPVIEDMTALQWLARNLVGSILIAFPFVLLPLWWAVRRGLRPLRTLVSRVTGRSPGDFSPLELDLRFAELQPLVQTFNQLLGQSRDAVARERALVQDAAHELRTPLAVIATQAHALAAAAPGPEQQQALNRLENAIARASHQVHQVLTLARLEGKAMRAIVPVECVETVRQALIDIEPRARAQGVELSLEAPERLDAMLDRVAFHSVLDNLVGNALDHAHGAARVQVCLRAAGDALSLCVADDGAGVSEEDRPHLFERFHRGRNAAAHGSGLGLSIVREAARLMGGDVQIRAGLGGQGIAFEVSVPWKRP
jgi:two-component system, OmpR family, sensor histidine kinase QseC